MTKISLTLCIAILISITFVSSAQETESLLEVTRTETTLTIVVSGTDPIDLYGLTFDGLSVDDLTTFSRKLSDDFPDLLASNYFADNGSCFIYTSTPPASIPESCVNTGQVELSTDEVFWANPALFSILSGNQFNDAFECPINTACSIAYIPDRILFDDFSDSEWESNARKWRNFTATCTYNQLDEQAIISSAVATSCPFALIDSETNSDVLPVDALVGFGATLVVQEGSNVDLSLGLYDHDFSWWLACGLRVQDGVTYAIFENPTELTANVYDELPDGTEPHLFTLLFVENEEIVCLLDNEPFGSVLISDTPMAESTQITRTINSTRSNEAATTILDDVYVYPNN